jgi:hypothetical protein
VKGLISFAREVNRLYKEIIFWLWQRIGFLLCMTTAMFLSFSDGSGMVMVEEVDTVLGCLYVTWVCASFLLNGMWIN